MRVLDTDILIGILRNNQDAIDKLSKMEEEAAVTVFSWQEILFGPISIGNRKEYDLAISLLESYRHLDYQKDDVFHAIGILTHLKKEGQTIGLIDAMIAAICLRHDSAIVTRNTGHFSRIPKLKIEKW